MSETAYSVNGIPIRLNAERWQHIAVGHPEVAKHYDDILRTLQTPDIVYAGSRNELLAVSFLSDSNGKYLVVVYKEVNQEDGFVITAYLSNKLNELQKRTIVWQRQN